MQRIKSARTKQFVISSALLAGIVFPGLIPQAQATQANALMQSAQTVSAAPSSNYAIAQATTPLVGEREDTVKRKSYMKTTITVSNQGGGAGRIDGVTRTWTDVKFAGFTGGVEVALLDKDQNLLHVTQLQKYGVNGRAIPGSSDRTERWSEDLPSGVVDKVASYAIRQRHTPTDRLADNLKKAKPVIETIIQLFTKSEPGSDTTTGIPLPSAAEGFNSVPSPDSTPGSH
jgi:hypothetical protein